MHELSIAQSIVEVVEAKAAENQASQINMVRLLIGDGSGIAVDSLAFCFEMLAGMDPLLTGASLLIDKVPYRARCRSCASEFTIPDFITRCPVCRNWETEVISGTELQILEMEFESASE
jgi:hydrogenase nickel incorporation protein HypA/HybF